MRIGIALLASLSLAAGCADEAPSAAAESDLSVEPDLFADTSSIALRFEGAFSTAFAAAHAGEPNGPLPGMPRRTFDELPGKLTFTASGGEAKTFDVTFKVRGNSSLEECPFAKLSVKMTPASKAAAKNTVFARHSKVKIGTHCADEPDDSTGTVGRLRNEKSPLRETFAYQALATVLPMSLGARAARIAYVDTSAGTTTERNAMLLEHVESLAKRSGAPDEACRLVDGEEECDPVLTDSELYVADPRQGMDRARIASISLFHAAIGNWDWRLELGDTLLGGGSRLWNTDVILLPKPGSAELVSVPVAQDFDLATATVGRLRDVDPKVTPAGLSAQAKANIDMLTAFTPAELDAAKATFRAKKEALYAAADRALMDERGHEVARAHLDAFFAEIER